MKAKVVFLARVKKAGKDTWPQVEIIRGRPSVAPNVEGFCGYYLRWSEDGKRKVVSVGQDADTAIVAYRNRERDHERIRKGLLPLNAITEVLKDFRENAPNASNRVHIVDAAAEFLAETRTLDRAEGTLYLYDRALRLFQESCSKSYLDEIDRRDILGYIQWLRLNLPRRVVGQQNTTIRNYLRGLRVFWNKVGFKFPLPTRDWPKATKKNAEKYSIEDINQMLAVANRDEKDLICFLLYTGFRDGEAAHCKYSDIDWRSGTINVHDKPEYGWTVKDREQRPIDIPLPADFVKRMSERRDRNKGCDLIFPNGNCRPNDNLIRVVRDVAKRAKIEGRVTLHKFRKTFGTMYAKRFGLETARQLLGHSKIETTALYLAAEEMDTQEAKASVEEIFSGVGD